MSHENALLERGFSVNKEIIVPNLKEENLVAQRLVYDDIQLKGRILEVDFNKKLLSYVRNSHKKYEEYLKNKKKKQAENEEQKKEEHRKQLRIKELEEKKKVMEQNFLNERADIERELRQMTVAKPVKQK